MSMKEENSIPAAITDTGCERDLNEDRYAMIESPSGTAWLVCDGMGGQAGGELAAQIAIDAIRRDLENRPARKAGDAIERAVAEANRIIVLRRQNQAFSGMGTTLVSAIFQGADVTIAHIGDSRAYLIRDSVIQQLTTDHTYVQQLVDKGEIQPEEALSHPQAHILTRAIGSEPVLKLDTRRFWLWEVSEEEPKDYILLCSDGLYSLISEEEMASLISSKSPQQACAEMVEIAKRRGGYDNITLAIIPLGGQLRQEPPVGYQEVRPEMLSQMDGGGWNVKVEIVRSALISIFLSILVVIATVLGVVVIPFRSF